MANYRSMIKGTASALGNKAKEKIKSAAQSNKLHSVYDRSSTTARCYANIAKLNVKINGETTEQKKAIGAWLCDYAEHRQPFDEIKHRHTLNEIGDVAEGRYDWKIERGRGQAL